MPSRALRSVCFSVFSTEKYSLYDGSTRNPTMGTVSTTAATKMKPMSVRPDCPVRVRMVSSPSADTAADPLERKAADVIPVEPDEECLATDVIVGHEAPIAAVVAVVAVVAIHQVVLRWDSTDEPEVIVYVVLLACI